MEKRRTGWGFALLCGVLALFFASLFFTDNKYQTPPPYGGDGVLSLTTADLTRGQPVYLIDGWLLTDDRTQNQPTWIGEFSNLRRGKHGVPPHGVAVYSLTLRYSGEPMLATVEFPELFTDYVVCLDGRELAHGTGNARVTFPLTAGEQTLTVKTHSDSGFYSGIYYPPALGTPQTLDNIGNLRSFVYGLAFLVPLALALFTFCLWRRDPVARWFGLLCCFFSLYVSYYFVNLFHLPFLRRWYLAEGLALYGLCYCVVRLTALSADAASGKTFLAALWVLTAVPVALLSLSLFIPVLSGAVVLHGLLKNAYFLLVFCCVVFFAARCTAKREREYRWILAGTTVFGVGLLLNLFFSNRFEPIRFFWQFEWCALLLVVLFGGMMAARNRRILAENAEFSAHLEQLVEKRTEELSLLLRERKAFFSDMAHDLKAPLFATKGFIDAIRKNNTGVDRELCYYLEQAEQKQQEMARRLQGLSTVNELDKIETPKELVSIRALLEEVYATHHAETEVASVHLRMIPPARDYHIFAQPEKLEILFENLIYNAVKATGAEGSITVAAMKEGDTAIVTVSDTGCGIPEEELAHLFARFFVGAKNRGSGTGLGLYIVQSIVTELGGKVTVASRLEEGTTFTINLPTVE